MNSLNRDMKWEEEFDNNFHWKIDPEDNTKTCACEEIKSFIRTKVIGKVRDWALDWDYQIEEEAWKELEKIIGTLHIKSFRGGEL